MMYNPTFTVYILLQKNDNFRNIAFLLEKNDCTNSTQNIRLSISSQKVGSLTTLGLRFDGACFGNPKEQGHHNLVVYVDDLDNLYRDNHKVVTLATFLTPF